MIYKLNQPRKAHDGFKLPVNRLEPLSRYQPFVERRTEAPTHPLSQDEASIAPHSSVLTQDACQYGSLLPGKSADQSPLVNLRGGIF